MDELFAPEPTQTLPIALESRSPLRRGYTVYMWDSAAWLTPAAGEKHEASPLWTELDKYAVQSVLLSLNGAQIEALKSQPRTFARLEGMLRVARAQQEARLPGERLKQMEFLHAQAAATTAEVEQARNQWLVARDREARVERDLATAMLTIAATTASQLTATCEHDAIRSPDKAHAALVPHDGRYVAPRTGKVLGVYTREGDFVAKGSALLAMALQDDGDVTAFLNPKHVEHAETGSRATVIFPDGMRLKATVVRLEGFAQRPPPEAPEVLGLRRVSVVVKLHCLEPIPARDAVSGLPVTVRFH